MFVLSFWKDIGNVIQIAFNLLRIIISDRPALQWASREQSISLIILLYSCGLGFFGVFFIWLALLSTQAVLPVNGFVESYRTAWHLILYMLKLHGPAVFVQDGKVLTTKEDNREGPGVAVVDFNSAVVLETRTPLPGITRAIFTLIHTLLQMVGLADKAESLRVAGPGIVFTGRGEQIRGAVDLRKQFRMQPATTAYTRDGIEVAARVFSIFTVGQPADILQVTYAGDPRPENLRVVTLEPVPEGHLRVTGMTDEIDRHDRDEIHHYIQIVRHSTEPMLFPYEPLPDTNTPPTYNPERVFATVFSEARADKEKLLPWSDLPSRVAASIFREMLSQHNFDELYNVGRPDSFPLPRYKTRMRLAMRNNGILSFRLLFHQSGQPLELRKTYLTSDLRISKITPLQNSKILRDRGIKIIMASFGDISPVNEAIYQHRLESWRASWERDTEIVGAGKELEAMRIRARARALAQQDIITSLNDILQHTELSQEVMAVRVLQSLESLAADTKTKNLLPEGTLDMMKATREWLLPGNVPPPPNPTTVEGDPLV